MADQPTWLYQAMCEHGALLYVGIAYDVPRRLSQHRATKAWWPDVDAVCAIQYDSRDHARRLESRIIAGVLPQHNIQGKPRRPLNPAPREYVLFDHRGVVIEAGVS